MKTCTFFGHSVITADISQHLQSVLINLIKNEAVSTFLVGNQGDFDHLVLGTLQTLEKIFPTIKYTVVLAYMPTQKPCLMTKTETVFPDAVATVPRKFAIDARNRWMLNHADVVITHVITSFGGAAKYKRLAEKSGKAVYNIAHPV